MHFPLSFFLMVTSGWKYFLRSRFRDRQIAAIFCLIKEGQLAVYGIQRFRVFSETIAVRYAHLFDQPFNVLIQCVQLSLHHKNDGDQLLPATVMQENFRIYRMLSLLFSKELLVGVPLPTFLLAQ